MSSLDQEPIDNPTAWVAKHIRRYVETNGEDGHIWHGVPSLLLTTVGRRSGKPRRSALYYATDAARYVVVASKGGADEHPDWYRNLLHTPAKLVPKLADIFRATARTATPSAHARLWPRLVELFPLYASYQRKTSRPIPLVILERV
jgi:deazaflavin-dependent oxidoreductase (nitroreductase family)